jgi:hypothetical protein
MGIGYQIGSISTNSTACADDIALVSNQLDQMQILINTAYDYAYMEGYQLHPTKSVVVNITHKGTTPMSDQQEFTLGPNKMPTVEKATHLGIIRTQSFKETCV